MRWALASIRHWRSQKIIFVIFQWESIRLTVESKLVLTAAAVFVNAIFALVFTPLAMAAWAMTWGALASANFALSNPSLGAASDWWIATTTMACVEKRDKRWTRRLVNKSWTLTHFKWQIFFWQRIVTNIKCNMNKGHRIYFELFNIILS